MSPDRRARQGRKGQVRLQPARHPRVRGRSGLGDPGGHPPGAHGVRVRRRWGLAKGGDVTLYYDGEADYTPHGSRFRGRINWVQIDLGDDDHDHLIDPDERMRIAMARQ